MTNMRHKDGARWPVKPGDIWGVGPHILACGDIESGAGEALLEKYGPAQLVYSDPPWNAGLASGFRTHAKVPRKVNFNDFLTRFIELVKHVQGDVWVEMGVGEADRLCAVMKDLGGAQVVKVPITYYRTKPAVLFLFTWRALPNFSTLLVPAGMDDADTPGWVMSKYEKRETVFDPCLGMGATLQGADDNGWKCIGLELNPVRLASSVERGARVWGDGAVALLGRLP